MPGYWNGRMSGFSGLGDIGLGDIAGAMLKLAETGFKAYTDYTKIQQEEEKLKQEGRATAALREQLALQKQALLDKAEEAKRQAAATGGSDGLALMMQQLAAMQAQQKPAVPGFLESIPTWGWVVGGLGLAGLIYIVARK